jgi:flagellar basal-body rod modification protein FlgD
MAIAATTADTSATAALQNAPKTATQKAAESQDRFLKLLVTQMQNQDPMNPMDNAQVTSQMAQIQTVSGIENLNGTVKSLSTQFTQMQALQGVSMVGHNVLVPGDRLNVTGTTGAGSYDLEATARSVKLEVLNAAGVVLDTQQLGDQKAGRHNFTVDAAKYAEQSNLKFRITANSSTGIINTTPYALDKVVAISNSNNTLQLELKNLGTVDYASVKALN